MTGVQTCALPILVMCADYAIASMPDSFLIAATQRLRAAYSLKDSLHRERIAPPNVKDEPRPRLARAVQQHGS